MSSGLADYPGEGGLPALSRTVNQHHRGVGESLPQAGRQKAS
jgi:hypothetical protein